MDGADLGKGKEVSNCARLFKSIISVTFDLQKKFILFSAYFYSDNLLFKPSDCLLLICVAIVRENRSIIKKVISPSIIVL